VKARGRARRVAGEPTGRDPARLPRRSLAAFLAVPFVVAAAVYLLRAPSAGASDTPPTNYQHGIDLGPLPRKDVPPLTDPAQIYLRDCATCHGSDARGTPRGPSLEEAGRAGVYYWVSTGRMPLPNGSTRVGRRRPAYPPPVVDRLVDYVAKLAGGNGPDIPQVSGGSLQDGLELFALDCASCHAWSGSGSIIFDGKVPSVVPATPEQVAAAIRIGPGEMPAYGPAALDQGQLDDLVAWVQTMKHKDDAGGYGLFHRGPTTEGAAALLLGLGAVLLAIGWIGAKAELRAQE
jgi:quinol---cytochrome-c reductase cytochrome c subunit